MSHGCRFSSSSPLSHHRSLALHRQPPSPRHKKSHQPSPPLSHGCHGFVSGLSPFELESSRNEFPSSSYPHDRSLPKPKEPARRPKELHPSPMIFTSSSCSTVSKTSKMPLELGSALSIDREPVNDPEIRTQALEAIYLISLQVRGSKSLYHPSVHVIRRMIETVLLWPCLNSDSVSKAQHGCIDCLALMICAELQAEEDFIPKRTSVVRKKGNSVVSYVINQFFNDKESTSTPELGDESIVAVPLSFRVCMGNVLISAFQKISESCKKQFAEVIPSVLHSVKFEKKSDIIAACIQVLFSAVYHLRSAVLPYASDLLKVSLKALRKKSDKLSFLFHERMAGAKLIASLMASEDVIVANISGGLLETRITMDEGHEL